MLAYLRLFRIPNLLMIALAQFLVRYCIIMLAYNTEFRIKGIFPEHLSQIEFLLFVFATVIIAAGGYVINDVYDVSTDEVNKPGKNMIGTAISEKTARSISYLLFIIGSIIGLSIAIKKHIIMMGFLFPFSAVSLYMYASYYKKRLLTGNILIAILSALSVLIVALFEPHFYINNKIVLIYALFAFMISLVREVIKDAEDMEGDELNQGKTFPIRFGLRNTKFLTLFLIVINVFILTYVLYTYFYHNTVINFWYLLGMIFIPYIFLSYLVASANKKRDFHYASVFAKLVMLLGVLTMIPFYYYYSNLHSTIFEIQF